MSLNQLHKSFNNTAFSCISISIKEEKKKRKRSQWYKSQTVLAVDFFLGWAERYHSHLYYITPGFLSIIITSPTGQSLKAELVRSSVEAVIWSCCHQGSTHHCAKHWLSPRPDTTGRAPPRMSLKSVTFTHNRIRASNSSFAKKHTNWKKKDSELEEYEINHGSLKCWDSILFSKEVESTPSF